ncbi:MAG: aromatic ring-hydroxylating dioxygenase subunit alpha [Congregibacter sp.]
MDGQQARDLARQVLQLKEAGKTFASDHTAASSFEIYRDPARFQQERESIFRRLPHAAAHASELNTPNGFVRREYAGVPLLLTRDEQGIAHAFVNTCRHRGMQLVADHEGCAKRFSCPYHAWTYANDGRFLSAPHFDQGFGELNKADLSLQELGCREAFGFIWVTLAHTPEGDFDTLLAPIADDLAALEIDSLVAVQTTETAYAANWKLLAEGGLEAYHFKIAHRKTIGPYFENNLSTYQVFGDHLRSVLPRNSLSAEELANRDFALRDHANLLYSLFPSSQLLAQQDHIVWIQNDPQAADRTAMRLITLAPRTGVNSAGQGSAVSAYWERNHAITLATLEEDFRIGEAIQRSVNAGLEQNMIFGRFESALAEFNATVERYLQA